MMKSKKWLIGLGLAVVLVVSFALPACGPGPESGSGSGSGSGFGSVFGSGSGSGSGSGEKISFSIAAPPGHADEAMMVVEDLQDFGLDVSLEIIDSTTFYEYLFYPNEGGMQAAVCAEDPSPDPWSDWIWQMLADPEGYGTEWNPSWYYNPDYDALCEQNYFAQTPEEKQQILYGLQQILATDIPMVYLVREQLLAACRSDRWDNWYNEMGGYATWINEYSIREVTNLTADTKLDIGIRALPNNLNMDQAVLQYTHCGCLYLMLVYENLAGYPKVGEDVSAAYDFVPKLATNYTVRYEDDGNGGENQVWTIDLREGVKWHDGEDFTADDVVYTCKYVISPWGVNEPVNWTAVDEDTGGDEILPEHVLVEKTGPLQVKMTYIDGWHQNEDFFPSVFHWDAIVPQHVFTAEGAPEDPLSWDGNCIGTGPYKVKEYETDDYILLERNDEYWGADDDYWGLPAAEEVLFRLYEDEGLFWTAFEAGEMESSASFSVPFEKKADYEADPDITVDVVDHLSIYWLSFNLHPTAGYAPLQDLALRQAIAAAIDKQGIADIVFGEWAEPADSWIYKESPNHKPDLPNNEYNLTEAERILQDAGYTKDDEGWWCLPVVDTKTETVTDDTVDATEEADTEVEVDGTATVTVARYEDNPGGDDPTDFNALDKYIDVYVPDTEAVTEIEIRLYYTDAEVEVAGVDEESLRLFWWDDTAWVQCSPDSGVNTASINGYSGYMWAKIRATGTTPTLDQLQGTEWGGYGHPSEPPQPLCSIATAAYGTDTAKELDILREFRDTALLPNSLGAEFVSLYYKTSPPIADFISQHEVLRTAVKVGFIDPIVKILTWTHYSWSA